MHAYSILIRYTVHGVVVGAGGDWKAAKAVTESSMAYCMLLLGVHGLGIIPRLLAVVFDSE